jgi:hypothetical protein
MRMHLKSHSIIWFFFLISGFLYEVTEAEENCYYRDEHGVFTSVESRDDIPETYKKDARCSKVSTRNKLPSSRNNYSKSYEAFQKHLNAKKDLSYEPENSVPVSKTLPASEVSEQPQNKNQKIRPDKVELSMRGREKSLNTLLGKVSLRWDAAAEKYFGGAIEGLVISAMNASSRVLSENSFPSELRMDGYDWQVVIMNDVPSDVDITINGENVCHPGWMRFPADIFIAGERIATGCSSHLLPRERATRYLVETMVHEIGHAVEYKFLGHQYRLHERWHKEGFATWFASLGSKYVSGGKKKEELDLSVKYFWNNNWEPLEFSGSNSDYMHGYAIIRTIADKKQINGLQKLYQFASKNNMPMLESIESHLGWKKKRLFNAVSHNFELR